jgi:hypothetical protein
MIGQKRRMVYYPIEGKHKERRSHYGKYLSNYLLLFMLLLPIGECPHLVPITHCHVYTKASNNPSSEKNILHEYANWNVFQNVGKTSTFYKAYPQNPVI